MLLSQALYRLYHPECEPTGACGISLQAWIAVFGASQLILSQLPDISSLREINLVCTLCTVCFAVGCLAMSIYNGAPFVCLAKFDPASGTGRPIRHVSYLQRAWISTKHRYVSYL